MPLPNSLPWMESVDAKMVRAHEHIETLDQEVNDYCSGLEIKTYLKTDPTFPHPWLIIHGSDYIPPPHISAVLGDCVHNMRAALDNLVCGLARISNRSCNCKSISFPFGENEVDWNANAQFDLMGVHRQAKKIIKSLQPWADPKTPSPLLMLNKLSNIDKHRHCNLALAYSHDTIFRIHCNNGSIVEVSASRSLFLGTSYDFMLPVPAAAVIPSARIQASAKLNLSFQEQGPWGDLPIGIVMHRCFNHIENAVIARLRRFFEPTPST